MPDLRTHMGLGEASAGITLFPRQLIARLAAPARPSFLDTLGGFELGLDATTLTPPGLPVRGAGSTNASRPPQRIGVPPNSTAGRVSSAATWPHDHPTLTRARGPPAEEGYCACFVKTIGDTP